MKNDIYKAAMKLMIGPGGLIQGNAFVDLVSTNVKIDMVYNITIHKYE
jgi:hypothetical protein